MVSAAMKNAPRGKVKTAVKTLVLFILDKSGSMGAIQKQTISGFNEYLMTLKDDKSSKTLDFSLTKFDTEVLTGEVRPVSKIKPLNTSTYLPGGATALYDSVYKTIVNGEQWEKARRGKYRILCVMQTDGQENSSRNYDQRDVADLIKAKEKSKKWSFVFLGADQDAWDAAQKFGIARGNTLSYRNAETEGTFTGALAGATVNYTQSQSDATSSFFASNSSGTYDPSDLDQGKKIKKKK